MSETARVDSIAELRAFRIALIKFADACNVALGDAESDMVRTLSWVERDQLTYWTGQLAKRADLITRAKEAVRMKKLYKSPTGGQQSYVEEEKALRAAIRLYEEAELKIAACKQWTRRLQKEIMMYKGGVTRFTSTLDGDIPRALAKLDAMAGSLEAYAAVGTGGETAGGAGGAGAHHTAGEDAVSMSRATDQVPEREGLVDVTALRDNVPPPEVRAAAPLADIREEAWAIPPLSAEARRRVSGLHQVGPPITGDDQLVVAKGTWSSDRIYLERRPPIRPGDTGWYLGSARSVGIVALYTVRVGDLLESRPDLREILTLPERFLVIIDDEGVRSILTPVGEDLWAAAKADG